MRKVVVVEGRLLPNGMMLAIGALKDPGKPIPVTMGFDHSTIVGKAVDFERNEETGEISFDIQFAPAYAGGEELIKDGEICLSAYGLEINDDILIESAKVGAACFSPFAGPFSIAKDDRIEEIDRNARAYGWEVGRGQDAKAVVNVSPDNPFLKDE